MSETIGQQLRQARETHSLTIEQVVEATRIRAHQIEAIEADDFESLPSPVQARAFLRIYAEYLGLSLDQLIARQRAGAGQITGEYDPSPPSGNGTDPAVPAVPAVTEASPEAAAEDARQAGARPRFRLPRFGKRTSPEEPAAEAAPPTPEAAPPKIPKDPPPAEPPAGPGQAESPEPEAPAKSQLIFDAIGETLRLRREALSLTLEEIERHTHVRKHYLLALETGQFGLLPSSVQGRGMLSNYAHFIDLDQDVILLKYADGLQAQRVERQPKPVEKPAREPRRLAVQIKLPKLTMPPVIRRYLSMDILVGGGLVVLLLTFAIWGAGRIMGASSAGTPEPTAPPISDVLIAASPEAAASSQPTTGAGNGQIAPPVDATLAVTLPPAGSGAVEIILVALDQAFVRVTVDGKVAFEGRVTAGMAYPFGGDEQIEVLTGDGSAVSILYNQSDLGPMGTYGEVVDRIYTVGTILNPTPTFTPTFTITPIPSSTPVPSVTPRPSSTPRPSGR